jgi:peptidoglycan/LPS O-acetylase OafA/YrhL
MAVLLALAFYTVVERPFMERTRRAPRRRHANPPRVALRA